MRITFKNLSSFVLLFESSFPTVVLRTSVDFNGKYRTRTQQVFCMYNYFPPFKVPWTAGCPLLCVPKRKVLSGCQSQLQDILNYKLSSKVRGVKIEKLVSQNHCHTVSFLILKTYLQSIQSDVILLNRQVVFAKQQ